MSPSPFYGARWPPEGYIVIKFFLALALDIPSHDQASDTA